jgi:hypothetical protein
VATYDGVACSDARGGAVSGPDRSIEVVRLESGREVLVARRAGYDDLIVDNVSSKDRSRVFQVATKSDDGRPFLRTYRIPLSGGPASLDVTDEFLDERETAGGFRARPGRSLLRCRLTASSAHSRSVVGPE